MSMGDMAGFAAFVVAIMGAAGTFWGVIRSANTKSKQDELALKQSEYQILFDELKNQLKTALGQIEQKQEFINELYVLQADCEIDHASLYEFTRSLHTTVKRLMALLVANGHQPEDIPDLPERRERKSERANYVLRKTEQNTQLSKKVINQVINDQANSIVDKAK